MIEVHAEYIDGVQFITKVKIISWERHLGLPVQEVDRRLLKEPRIKDVLRSLMLEPVDWDYSRAIRYYAQRPVNDLVYKAVKLAYLVYWLLIRVLYKHARVFQQIPEREPFSWCYFTPYCWLKSIQARFHQNENS